MQTEKNGVVYALYLALCLGAAVYFVSSAGGSAQAGAGGDDGDAVMALMGGGSGGSSSGASARSREGRSLFESEFYKEGQLTERIEDPQSEEAPADGEPRILEAADPNNPVNPQTGERYTNAVMQTFDKLRDKFPGNDLIPKRISEEERQKDNKERQRILGLQAKIASGNASEEEVTDYYDAKAKPMQDRLELVNYVLDEKGGEMGDSIKQQYEKILKMSEDQLKAIEAQREMAKQRLGNN